MISLFIDTSGSDVSIALVKDNVVLSKIIECIPNKHSVYTTSYLDKILKSTNIELKDIDKVMVVNGPGSFTGVRIGVTIAKVFAYILKKEIICLSSLKIRAISTSHDYCLSVMKANKGHYYVGLYDKDNLEVVEEVFCDINYINELITKYNPVVVGDNDYEDISIKKQELDIVKIVNYYKNSESKNVHLVVPNYLKLPQALEEKK